MKTIIIILLIAIILAILISIVLYIKNEKDIGYFKGIASDNLLKGEMLFYIKKHTIFRLFFILYSVTHYVLNIISVIFSMVSIYMFLDDDLDPSVQAIFLLIAAISSNLSIGLRFDRIAEGYIQAMRIMENAILNYAIDQKSSGLQSLREANDKAEQYIQKYFM